MEMCSVYHIRRKGMKINEGYVGITNNFKIRKRSHIKEAFESY